MTVNGKPNSILTIVGPQSVFPKVTCIEPAKSGYLILALEIDHRIGPSFCFESGEKRAALVKLQAVVEVLKKDKTVIDVTLFKALIIPPGKGKFLQKRPKVAIAKYDVVLLVEYDTPNAAKKCQASELWQGLEKDCAAYAKKTMTLLGSNARRIAAVDHTKPGVFLFNYFYADDLDKNLSVWDYTAGWFQYQTGLDNSTLILPASNQPKIPYTVINHCRWDSLIRIVPSLLFKPSFTSFVLDNFEANNVAAMPILYRLA
jgi:hypothetical protein